MKAKSSKKKYYPYIDIIRVLACMAILLYHLNILKGGYLAVCVFFVLSGYLTCISAFKKEKFSILSYYRNRLLKIYLPLIIVVFTTIAIISFLPNINWFNLKPETTSILLGYNNFWQLNANLDYFARHINSPFIHLWYIAILLQFDLIFPFIYLIFNKIGKSIHKIIPCIITATISIICTIYFYKMILTQNMMITYYNTFTRIFSLLFGLSLGFIHSYYKPLIPKKLKKKPINKIIFYIYLTTLICLFILIDAKSKYFPLAMIFVTIITCRLIEYSTIIKKRKSITDKYLKYSSDISYEIYLIQYPIIYLFQYVNIVKYLKIPLIIIITFILSYLLHFGINLNKKKKKYWNYICYFIILCISLYGGYRYLISKDHTAEMKKFESELAEKEKLMQKRQEEFNLKQKEEEDYWLNVLENLSIDELTLQDIVTNLSVVGIGDSIMLGAIDNLYEKFPNGYFDAQTSRTAWQVTGILQSLKNQNIFGEPVILNLGANGDCPESCKVEIMETCENRDVFWINVPNDSDVFVNDKLLSLASNYDNLHIIDWYTISSGHPEYFIADGIHLTKEGAQIYAKSIYDNIYQVYLKKYQNKLEEAIRQHDEGEKNKITFYGNDLLLNFSDYIQDDFNDSLFVIDKNFDYSTLKDNIDKSIKNDSLTNKIVFALDNTSYLTVTDYQNLTYLCKDHEIYIISISDINQDISKLNNESITVIDFYQEIKQHPNYLMVDKIHLTKEGNLALSEILKSTIG